MMNLMDLHIPQFVIQSLFYRIVGSPEPVRTSSVFLHRGKCPLCLDYKKRMYLKQYPNHYHIYCHNCGYSNNFFSFIKKHFPEYEAELEQYVFQYLKHQLNPKVYKPQDSHQSSDTYIDEQVKLLVNDLKLKKYLSLFSFCINDPQEHQHKEYIRQKCIEYVNKRKIQYKYWKDFVFFYKGVMKGYLGIPMWNEQKYLLHIQGRLLFPSKHKSYEQPKYLFLKDVQEGIENIPKPIYGLWKVNTQKTCYISEGTISSLAFDDQGLATCGAHISSLFISQVKKKFCDVIWSFDNYWIDKTAKEKIEMLLRSGEKCFLIPKETECKDTNDLLVKYNWEKIPEDYIEKNIYKGEVGLLKIKMKKIL